jgi:peptidyl-prolyl cis-trans isomerase SurA
MRSSNSLAHLSGRALILAFCAAIPAASIAADQDATQSTSEAPAHATKRSHAKARAKAKARALPSAKAVARPAGQDQLVDGIAAVVNKDVITYQELRIGVQQAKGELHARKIQAPDDATLQRQVLQRLILDRIQAQEADRLGIKVNDAQIDRAIEGIAQRNKISTAQMKVEVAKTGVDWDKYRDTLRGEIRQDLLRQRAVDANIVISDTEVDAYLKEQARLGANGGNAGQGPFGAPTRQQTAPVPAPAPRAAAAPQERVQSGPALLALAQILVHVPENAMSSQVATLKQKAEGLLAKVKGGEDFAAVAAASSDGPEALKGGVMGGRPESDWPDLFINAVKGLQAGQVSRVIQSGQGFHILKVLGRRAAGEPVGRPQANVPDQPPPAQPNPAQPGGADQSKLPAGPMIVEQTHARHILIKLSSVINDEQAQQRLTLLRQRIVDGHEDFAEIARQSSQDVSAPQGGDLGWLNPGDTVPAFQQAMNGLKPGQVSQPIKSPFGWHLIQVLERRQHDIADEYKRVQARRILFARRAEPAFEDYLSQLHDQAYIDNRLEKRDNEQKANP